MKTFPKLYRAHDDVDNQPCLRIDDAVGRRVLNVTLSGYMPGVEPSPAEWAAHVERACNNHERLVDALKELRLQCQQSRKFIALCDEGYELYQSTAAAIERADVAIEALNQ